MRDALPVLNCTALDAAEPRCPHFGTCGGCQYQNIAYADQLALKRDQLALLLTSSGLLQLPELRTHSAEPYAYRNRIRLRIKRVGGALRAGYNVGGTTEFLPITTCPIAAPILWESAQALLAAAGEDRDAAFWLNATAEVELFTNDALDRLQITLFCAPRTKAQTGSFSRFLNALQQRAPQIVGASAAAFDPRTGPTGRTLETHGAAGLNYRVGEESYWVSRGGFFQVNRFLLPTLVDLVTCNRRGDIGWDLFAGVGLFSRVLARHFKNVTAVEANPTAVTDLATALKKLGGSHRAVAGTTLDFLRAAVLQRERPDLVVLDPPRAGAGVDTCTLIAKLGPKQIVYVSCDPATLARDLRVLQDAAYRIDALHLMDLFPQTQHIETVAMLSRA